MPRPLGPVSDQHWGKKKTACTACTQREKRKEVKVVLRKVDVLVFRLGDKKSRLENESYLLIAATIYLERVTNHYSIQNCTSRFSKIFSL